MALLIPGLILFGLFAADMINRYGRQLTEQIIGYLVLGVILFLGACAEWGYWTAR
jgi:hypothetical protein